MEFTITEKEKGNERLTSFLYQTKKGEKYKFHFIFSNHLWVELNVNLLRGGKGERGKFSGDGKVLPKNF